MRAGDAQQRARRGQELSNLYTVKVGSRFGESDTIYIACTALGRVLGTDFAAVQSGTMK